MAKPTVEEFYKLAVSFVDHAKQMIEENSGDLHPMLFHVLESGEVMAMMLLWRDDAEKKRIFRGAVEFGKEQGSVGTVFISDTYLSVGPKPDSDEVYVPLMPRHDPNRLEAVTIVAKYGGTYKAFGTYPYAKLDGKIVWLDGGDVPLRPLEEVKDGDVVQDFLSGEDTYEGPELL